MSDVERPEVNEQPLIAASQRGDVTAFNRLVILYQEQAYNLAYRMLGNSESAADAAQDTFVSAFQAIKSFRGGSFRAWVLRIATNACYDQLRRAQRQPAVSLDAIIEETGDVPPIASNSPTPEEVASRKELAAYIQRSLLELPPEQRIVVALSDVQGLSYDEIAEVTGSSLGTVKSRLSRGRAHLRDYLLRQPELLPSDFRHKSRGT